ncbi:MAG: multicopper oxidase domain-containing protein [Betaproteobacteria bacterium]
MTVLKPRLLVGLVIAASAACGGQSPAPGQSAAPKISGDNPWLASVTPEPTDRTAGPPLSTRNMPPVAGQQKTCAGPQQKTFDLDVIETKGIDIGMGMRFAAWTYDGRLPGPTLEACEGDTVTINVHNKGTTSHGLDTHAFKIDARHYGPTPPGTTLTMKKTVETPGVYMYHCSAGPVTDLHIKSGIHGAMIVYPRNERLRPAREIVVVEDAIYGTPDAHGFIPGTDPSKTAKNDELLSMFNGRLDNDPVSVNVGDLVRMYFVNVGPGVSSAHVIGGIFDRVYAGAPPIEKVQTFAVPAGDGAIFEFYVPEAGVFPFVDHDKLAFLPYGMALAFSAQEASATKN